MKILLTTALAIFAIAACSNATRADLPPAAVPLPPALKPAPTESAKPAMPAIRSDAAALTATSWRVTTMLGQPAPQSPPATMTFDANRVSGSTGCNRYGAEYRVTDDTIRTSQAMSTKMACPGPQMDLEQDFNRALAETRHFAIDASGHLTLSSEAEVLIVAVPMDTPE
jgi:heat shock protein HslJ